MSAKDKDDGGGGIFRDIVVRKEKITRSKDFPKYT